MQTIETVIATGNYVIYSFSEEPAIPLYLVLRIISLSCVFDTSELCHQEIKEHSRHYWNMLHKLIPNYHDKIEWLKVNGSNLL